MNKQSFLSILAASIVIASCGKNDKSAQAGGAPQVKEYKTVTLQPESATLNSDFPASIQGQQNIEIRPRVEGYIEKIYVDEGAVVKAGQPLFKINAPEYEQQVRTATASIKSAQAAVSSAKESSAKESEPPSSLSSDTVTVPDNSSHQLVSKSIAPDLSQLLAQDIAAALADGLNWQIAPDAAQSHIQQQQLLTPALPVLQQVEQKKALWALLSSYAQGSYEQS